MALVPNENSPAPDSYHALLIEIKERIRSAQYAALHAVNLDLLSLYWDIGRLIDQRQQGEGLGACRRSIGAQLQPGFLRDLRQKAWWGFRLARALSAQLALREECRQLGLTTMLFQRHLPVTEEESIRFFTVMSVIGAASLPSPSRPERSERCRTPPRLP